MKKVMLFALALGACAAPERGPGAVEMKKNSTTSPAEPPMPDDPCAPGGTIERLAGKLAQSDMKTKGAAAVEVRRLAANYLLPDCSARREELRSDVFAGFHGGDKETLLAATELVVVIEAPELFTAVAHAITNHAASYKEEVIGITRKMNTERWVAGVKRMLPDERVDMRLGALMMLDGEIHDAATGWVKKLVDDPDERIQSLARKYMEGAAEVAELGPVSLEDLPTIGKEGTAMPMWHIELQQAVIDYRKLKKTMNDNSYAALVWQSVAGGLNGEPGKMMIELRGLAEAQPPKIKQPGKKLLGELKKRADAIQKTLAELTPAQLGFLAKTDLDASDVLKDRVVLAGCGL